MTYEPPCNREHIEYPFAYKTFSNGYIGARAIEYIAWDSTHPTSRPVFVYTFRLYTQSRETMRKEKHRLHALSNWELSIRADAITDPRRYDPWWLDRCARQRVIYQYEEFLRHGYLLDPDEDISCLLLPPLKPRAIKTYRAYEASTGWTVEYLQATTKKAALEIIRKKYKTKGIQIKIELWQENS